MVNRTVSFVRVDADDFDPDAGFAKKGDKWDDEDQDLKLAVGVSKWVRSLFLLPLALHVSYSQEQKEPEVEKKEVQKGMGHTILNRW